MYRNRIKRLLDILLSACGILCLSWLLLLLAIAIKLDSPGPVFFRQKRVGIGKRHFQILKFRTMRIDTPHDMPTHLLHDPEQYITRMGHFLRKTSLADDGGQCHARHTHGKADDKNQIQHHVDDTGSGQTV